MFFPVKCSKCGEEISRAEILPDYYISNISAVATVPLSFHICRHPDGRINKAAALSPYQMCPHGVWNGDCLEHDPLKEYAAQEGWVYKVPFVSETLYGFENKK